MKALFAALLLPMILGAQTPARNTWTVTSVAGPMSWPGHKLKVSLVGNLLSFSDSRAKRKIEIRADAITQAAYSHVRFSRAQQLGGKYDSSGWFPVGGSGCNAPGCGGVLLAALIADAVAAPMHGTSHFILLTWIDRDVEQQIQFEVGKSDVPSFNARLHELAGVRWIDVDAQRQAAESQIKNHGSDAFLIELERDSWCGVYALPNGSYRVLVAPGDPNATVYFFAGSVDLARLRAVLPAQIKDSSPADAFVYAPGTARIASIRWQDKSLDFLMR